MPRRTELTLCTLILLLAAWLRLYRLSDLPPGWRDDEVVETTVHAAVVLAGRAPLYFPQAEGHEPLYHYLSAGWIVLAGRSLFSVRLLSALLGVLSVAALYRLARRLFGPSVALLAAAGLAVSFWGLMYARFKLRHVAMLAPMLLALEALWRAGGRRTNDQGPRTKDQRQKTYALRGGGQADQTLATPDEATGAAGEGRPGTHHAPRSTRHWRAWALAGGAWLAVALYTYYAARVLPVVVVGFGLYLAVLQRGRWRAAWQAWALGLGAAAVLSLPLAAAIALTPGGEARLGVVGGPLRALLSGDPGPALANTLATLGMFAFTGDPEALYNIPGRPVFEPLGALLFALGVGVSAWRWRQPRHALLLLWVLGGLAPAFLSVPAASLGHTIAAQPVFYIFPALGLAAAAAAARDWPSGPFVTVGLALVFVAVTAWRDGRDYFSVWPRLPEVRRLYRADLHAAAGTLRALPPGRPLWLASYNLHPADALALGLETSGLDLAPRVFNPAGAWPQPGANWPVLRLGTAPGGEAFGQPPLREAFALVTSRTPALSEPETALNAAFENGWTCTGYTLRQEGGSLRLYTYWRVAADYAAPAPRPVEALAGTPLPLKFFSHLLGPDGAVLAGDDRLDVDPAYLRAGDAFIQLFELSVPGGTPPGRYPLQVGVYDPQTGARARLTTGADSLVLTEVTWP